MISKSALAAACAVAFVTTPAAAAPGDKLAGQYICVFKAGAVSKANARAEANRATSQAGGQIRHIYDSSIRGFAANMSETAAAQLSRRNANVAFCEQDQEVGIIGDPMIFREVGRPAPAQSGETVPWGIAKVNGGSGTATGRAWVIDSGIDLDHPDLNVRKDLSRNHVFRETSPDDLNGHGTHVAGTIGAIDNSIGVIGVAPGAEVVAVRVLNRRGSGSNSDVIAGVDYVAQAGESGDVANMSLTGGASEALDGAVSAAASTGIRFTLAAGNNSASATNYSPARVNGANIYTVGSFTSSDSWSSFSNHGLPPLDYIEPGSGIYSTYKDGGYNTLSGTSMAAPHLAGILLLGVVRSEGTITHQGIDYPIGKH